MKALDETLTEEQDVAVGWAREVALRAHKLEEIRAMGNGLRDDEHAFLSAWRNLHAAYEGLGRRARADGQNQRDYPLHSTEHG